jgi:hypothetical protein
LANGKSNDALPGWLLKNPTRRAIHQPDIFRALDKLLPEKTDEYLKQVEILPEEVQELLRLELLERGFQLRCRFCSALVWYRADEVGQFFRCQRCYEEQRLPTNPIWLYKLPEVVFQFFENDSEVPLLALFRLLTSSTKNFQYVLDSNVFASVKEKHGRNIDFCCLSDGRVYIGEAKSNDALDNDQFEFYEKLIAQLGIDGVVFATTEPHWSPSAMSRIENLRSNFKGEVLALTKSELLEN